MIHQVGVRITTQIPQMIIPKEIVAAFLAVWITILVPLLDSLLHVVVASISVFSVPIVSFGGYAVPSPPSRVPAGRSGQRWSVGSV
jgi:hypothetical protein